jgi:hypothetical protein
MHLCCTVCTITFQQKWMDYYHGYAETEADKTAVYRHCPSATMQNRIVVFPSWKPVRKWPRKKDKSCGPLARVKSTLGPSREPRPANQGTRSRKAAAIVAVLQPRLPPGRPWRLWPQSQSTRIRRPFECTRIRLQSEMSRIRRQSGTTWIRRQSETTRIRQPFECTRMSRIRLAAAVPDESDIQVAAVEKDSDTAAIAVQDSDTAAVRDDSGTGTPRWLRILR